MLSLMISCTVTYLFPLLFLKYHVSGDGEHVVHSDHHIPGPVARGTQHIDQQAYLYILQRKEQVNQLISNYHASSFLTLRELEYLFHMKFERENNNDNSRRSIIILPLFQINFW